MLGNRPVNVIEFVQMPSPPDPEFLLELARGDLASDRPAAAEAKCLQLLGARQHHPGALQVLGQALHCQGRYEDAVRVFNALTLLEPTIAGHWQNLAAALRPTKRHTQAIAAFERALQLAPPSAALLYNLGVLQMERCDYHAAYLALRDAVVLAPGDATVRWGFAQCCYDLLNLEEALAALQHWQELEGLTIEITVRIVFLLVMMGATQQALPAIQRLLTNPPQKGRAAVGMISILERLHRLDDARAMMERLELNDRSLDTDPERLMLSATLAERAGQFEAAYRSLSLALDHQQGFLHRHHLLYSLAKIHDSLGRYEEAFAAAEEAHRSQMAYLDLVMGTSSVRDSWVWSRTANGCSSDDVAPWESATGPSMLASPILIVGFPRSGTTLLEQVLDAHPLLQSMDEQPFLMKAMGEVTDLGIGYPAELGRLTEKDLDTIRARYWERAGKKVCLGPGQRLVDKNPLNLLLLPLIRRLFPNASIILAIRHPCDVLLSCFLQEFRAPELALVCRDLATLAEAYCRAFEFWHAQCRVLRPCSHELRYEMLTADLATEVRKLCAFLQLPWHDAMLAPGESARAKGFISTPSYSQVVEPVSSKSVGRWKRYETHFSGVLPGLRPWLEHWGYPAT